MYDAEGSSTVRPNQRKTSKPPPTTNFCANHAVLSPNLQIASSNPQILKIHPSSLIPTMHPPADCFDLATLQHFQAFEGQVLKDVLYYYWLHPEREGSSGFLYYVEWVFDSNDALLLSAGQDSTALRVGTAADLVGTAGRLQDLHGKPIIQKAQAGRTSLWQPFLGRPLQSIRLSRRDDSEWYANDALLLDFGEAAMLVRLHEVEGMAVHLWGGMRDEG